MARISNLVENIASTYDTHRIIILGKGPSVDEIEEKVFENSLIIALNDAEWITDPDITIFHESWVGKSISLAGNRSKLYLTSTNFQPTSGIVERFPYEPLGNDTSDLMMSRFYEKKSLEIEEIMLLTALKVARLVADQKNVTHQVYLVGLDFTPGSGYSKKIKSGLDPKLDPSRSAGIEMQRHFLNNALYMLKDSNLDISHVGHQEMSALTPSGLNSLFGLKPLAGEVGTSEVQNVVITAEITTNHFGDRNRLESLILKSSQAGADFVKFQIRDVDSFYSKEQLIAPYASPFGTTFGEYRHALELDREDFAFIDELCAQVGIGWFLSVLDQVSFEKVQELKPAMIKLPSTISEHTGYLKHVSETYNGPLVLSTGMTDKSYEDWVLRTFKSQEKLYLLHANSAYPTPEQDCNIGVIRRYSEMAQEHPHIIPGWSSHDPGWMGSALAVAAGAGMVEKHVKLGNTEWAHFDAVALDLTTSDFEEYVVAIRRAQSIVGSSTKRVTKSEHHKYWVSN